MKLKNNVFVLPYCGSQIRKIMTGTAVLLSAIQIDSPYNESLSLCQVIFAKKTAQVISIPKSSQLVDKVICPKSPEKISVLKKFHSSFLNRILFR